MTTGEPTANTLAGKVAIITGGGRGIGRAMALELAAAGVAVMVSARSANEIEETAEMIRAAGGTAKACPADVSDLDAVKNLLAVTEAELGAPDILINKAGGGVPGTGGPFELMEPAAIQLGVERNLLAAMLLSRLALPGMLARSRRYRHFTDVAPWRMAVRTQSIAVSPPPSTSTRLPARLPATTPPLPRLMRPR